MALSATFTANFASFYAAVDKADAKLKDFGAGADKVGGRLNTMANKFSGQKIVQEATVMVKAVESIGGVAALTEKELAQLGATTQEAVAKMRALGMDVPKNLQRIADQTKGATKAATDWVGTLTKVAGAMGIAFSIDTIKNFIGSIFSAASAIKDLSDQWGFSTTAVQKWSGAAAESGVAAETVGKSIQFLTEKLAEGSDAYAALLANVGLSQEELRAKPLEDAYKDVIRAIAGIKDPILQLDIAMGLLGPSAKKMIGAIRDGLVEATEAQKAMGDETIRRLEAAQAQWEKFGKAVITISGEMLGAILKDARTMTQSWGDFFATAGTAIANSVYGPVVAKSFLQARQANEALKKSHASVSGEIHLAAEATTALGGKMKTTTEILEENRKREEALKRAVQDRAAAQDRAKREQEAYNRSLGDYTNSLIALGQTFAGYDIIGKAQLYLAALKESIPVQQMTRAQQEEINRVMVAAIEVYHAMGEVAPRAMIDTAIATAHLYPEIDQAKKSLEEWLKVAQDVRTQLPTKLLDMPLPTGAQMAPPPGVFAGIGKDLAAALSKSVLSAIQGGGNIFQAAGSTIGNFLLDPKQSGVGKAIEGAAKKLPGLIGGAISTAIPVVGSFIGPAVGWLAGKISGWFGKKEHEKLRDGFVKAAGGIGELRTAAEAAGFSLDNLFRAKNTEGVKAAIGEIEAALNFQASAYDAAIEAAQRYGFTLEELGPAMARQELDKQAQQLYKDWEVLNSAGIDTIAITERMSESVSEYVKQASVMGMEIPAAMRPMLEAFARNGQLIDANGNAITDLEAAGISFSMTMSEGFRELIAEVRTLTDAISRSLGVAIRNIPDVEVEGRVTWDVDKIPTPSQVEALESYQKGTGGFKNFGTGTPVMLHGWEAVVPRDESGGSAAFATVDHGGMSPAGMGAPALAASIVINAQGAFFDTPGDLQRLADRVNEALTAKMGLRTTMRAG